MFVQLEVRFKQSNWVNIFVGFKFLLLLYHYDDNYLSVCFWFDVFVSCIFFVETFGSSVSSSFSSSMYVLKSVLMKLMHFICSHP